MFYSPRGTVSRGDYWLSVALLGCALLVLAEAPIVGPLLLLLGAASLYCVSARRLRALALPTWLTVVPLALVAVSFGLVALNIGPEGEQGLVTRPDVALAGQGVLAILAATSAVLATAYVITLGIAPDRRIAAEGQ